MTTVEKSVKTLVEDHDFQTIAEYLASYAIEHGFLDSGGASIGEQFNAIVEEGIFLEDDF